MPERHAQSESLADIVLIFREIISNAKNICYRDVLVTRQRLKVRDSY